MRTSATGRRSDAGDKRGAGFTLVELMVVMAIVALAAAAVTLAFPGRDRALDDAERFAARADAAATYAVLAQRPVRLSVDGQGYRFEERAAAAWRPARDRHLAARRWEASALVDGGRGSTVFDPAGGADPLQVTLVDGATRAAVEVGADGRAHVAR